MQLETAFRQRMAQVHQEVKRRLVNKLIYALESDIF